MARRLRAALLLCFLVAGIVTLSPPANATQAGRRSVDVLVPEGGNLQLLAFWTALGGGYFTREGLDVHPVTPEATMRVPAVFTGGGAPVAILSGIEYERLIADGFPFLLAANLLQNDPLELVMRRTVADRLQLGPGTPLARRLHALRGVTLGVAVPDRARLYALFHSQGIDANSAQLEVRKPDELIDEFDAGKLDVIYVGTPYAEHALVDKDGVVLVDAAGGEVAPFSERMIQALAVTRAFATEHADDVLALVHALAKAEHSLRDDPAMAATTIEGMFPKLRPKRVAKGVSIYARAVPSTPHVEALLLKREAAFYPVGGPTLDISGANLESFVFVSDVPAPSETPFVSLPRSSRSQPTSKHGHAHMHAKIASALALVLGLALLFLFIDQREGQCKDGPDEGL